MFSSQYFFWTTSWYTLVWWKNKLTTYKECFLDFRKHHFFTNALKCSIMVREVDSLDLRVMLQGASPLKKKV